MEAKSRPPHLSSKSEISISVKPSSKTFGIDEPVSFDVSILVSGAIREAFTQVVWEQAYDLNDMDFRVTYQLSLKSGVLSKPITKQKFVKRAKLYWSRNPDIPYRVWAMIVDEERNPHIPASSDDALSRLFSLSRNITIMGSDLGHGRHRIFATVKVKWGRHTFAEHGYIEAVSEAVDVVCR